MPTDPKTWTDSKLERMSHAITILLSDECEYRPDNPAALRRRYAEIEAVRTRRQAATGRHALQAMIDEREAARTGA